MTMRVMTLTLPAIPLKIPWGRSFGVLTVDGRYGTALLALTIVVSYTNILYLKFWSIP